MKTVAERLNRLQMDTLVRTPESILHQIEVKEIPMKSFHTLFWPAYVIDAHLQSNEKAGPPKWELYYRIGVYLGHLPFHAGSIALFWNSTTVRVSPQYHILFDDDFTTVQLTELGTIPSNWGYLVNKSLEKSTPNYVDLSNSWMNGLLKAADSDQL